MVVRVKRLIVSALLFFLGACVMIGYQSYLTVYDIRKIAKYMLTSDGIWGEPSTRPLAVQSDEYKTSGRKGRNCRLRKEFVAAKSAKVLDTKVWDKVQIFLLFIGYERSGHSLVSALLDAHPNMVIADELHALRAWQRFPKENKTRNHLFQALYSNSVQLAQKGERSSEDCKSILGGYKYHVPNQWQGYFNGNIKVIGDKQGPQTVRVIQYQPNNKHVFPAIREAVNVPIKFVHVLRNPFDIVGRIVYRRHHLKREYTKGPVNTSRSLQIDQATDHARLTRGVVHLMKKYGDDVITIHSEDMIENPVEELKRLCQFLSVSCSTEYLKDCSSIVSRTPSKSRYEIFWNDEARNILNELILKTPMLQRYKFDEE